MDQSRTDSRAPEDHHWLPSPLTTQCCHHQTLHVVAFKVLCVCVFLGPHLWHMEVPRLGVESELQLRPRPQPQQHQIWAESETYTTAHNSTGSLIHWVRPGIEPTFSRTLCGILISLSHRGAPVIGCPGWDLGREKDIRCRQRKFKLWISCNNNVSILVY